MTWHKLNTRVDVAWPIKRPDTCRWKVNDQIKSCSQTMDISQRPTICGGKYLL